MLEIDLWSAEFKIVVYFNHIRGWHLSRDQIVVQGFLITFHQAFFLHNSLFGSVVYDLDLIDGFLKGVFSRMSIDIGIIKLVIGFWLLGGLMFRNVSYVTVSLKNIWCRCCCFSLLQHFRIVKEIYVSSWVALSKCILRYSKFFLLVFLLHLRSLLQYLPLLLANTLIAYVILSIDLKASTITSSSVREKILTFLLCDSVAKLVLTLFVVALVWEITLTILWLDDANFSWLLFFRNEILYSLC